MQCNALAWVIVTVVIGVVRCVERSLKGWSLMVYDLQVMAVIMYYINAFECFACLICLPCVDDYDYGFILGLQTGVC